MVLLCFAPMFIQQKVMFIFKVNNQLKGTNTCLLRMYVFIVNFPIFTTYSLLYVATIAADNHVKLIIAAVVKQYSAGFASLRRALKVTMFTTLNQTSTLNVFAIWNQRIVIQAMLSLSRQNRELQIRLKSTVM